MRTDWTGCLWCWAPLARWVRRRGGRLDGAPPKPWLWGLCRGGWAAPHAGIGAGGPGTPSPQRGNPVLKPLAPRAATAGGTDPPETRPRRRPAHVLPFLWGLCQRIRQLPPALQPPGARGRRGRAAAAAGAAQHRRVPGPHFQHVRTGEHLTRSNMDQRRKGPRPGAPRCRRWRRACGRRGTRCWRGAAVCLPRPRPPWGVPPPLGPPETRHCKERPHAANTPLTPGPPPRTHRALRFLYLAAGAAVVAALQQGCWQLTGVRQVCGWGGVSWRARPARKSGWFRQRGGGLSRARPSHPSWGELGAAAPRAAPSPPPPRSGAGAARPLLPPFETQQPGPPPPC